MECIGLYEFLGTADQIQERKQKDPDDVDEVPIQAADFDRREITRTESATPGHDQNCSHQADANDHVECVKARHEKVEAKHDLGLPRELRSFAIVPRSEERRV